MKLKTMFQTLVLFAMLLSMTPEKAGARAVPPAPPVDMFQLPWELGASWVAFDGFDNGSRRAPTSPHNYLRGGAVDFAPQVNMTVGMDTSTFWVNAAAAGTVRTVSSCHIVIDHGSGWTTEYWHLANIQVHVSDVVSRNQKLAVIADNKTVRVCTGNEFPGPHLHFVMRPAMKDTKFAGWTINFNSTTNLTTFSKNGQTVNQYQPILNVMDTTSTPTPTRTITQTSTATVTGTSTTTNTVTSTSTPTTTSTSVPTNTNTTTSTPVVTNTQTPTGTLPNTNTPTSTLPSVATNTPTVTMTPLITNTPSIATGTSTVTSTPVLTNTPTSTSTPPGSSLTPTNTALPTGPYVLTDATQPNLLVGETSPVTVSLINVPIEGYTSAEFTCTYNQNLLSVSNITVAGLFGPGPVVAINGPQNGSFILAMVGINGNEATTSGAVFTFNVSALQIGQSPVACTARVSRGLSIYENIAFVGDTVNILGTVTPTVPTSTPPGPPPPLLTGQVFASKLVTISLYNPDSTLAASLPVNPQGIFNVNLAAGSYTVVASASGFLNAQGAITIANGQTITMPTINLIPGDVDGNSVINQLDALTIGMNYNGSSPTAADLNNDGVINVLDLQLLAAHYGQSGALVW